MKTYAILGELVRAGWVPGVERSEPRLRGEARFDYTMATDSVNGLDPEYVPTLKSEAENFRSYVESDDRPRWKELLPGVLQALAVDRKKKEEALKAKGVQVDASYTDPLPPL